MYKPKSIIFKIIVAFICSLFLYQSQTLAAEKIEGVLALVNDEVVLFSDFLQFKENLKQTQFNDDLLIPDQKTKDALKTDNQLVIKKLIHKAVINSEINRLKLNASDDRVQKEVTRFAKKNGMNLKQFSQALASEGLDLNTYKNYIKQSIERTALIDREIRSKVSVTEQDIKNHILQSDSQSKNQNFEYKLSHIMLKGFGNKSRQKINEIHKALLAKPELFASISDKESQDPNHDPGGYFGDFKSNELLPAFKTALSDLSTGDISSVTKGNEGYYIFKVLGKKVVSSSEYDNVKNEARAFLFAEGQREAFKNWLDGKMKSSFIHINK